MRRKAHAEYVSRAIQTFTLRSNINHKPSAVLDEIEHVLEGIRNRCNYDYFQKLVRYMIWKGFCLADGKMYGSRQDMLSAIRGRKMRVPPSYMVR